MEVEPALIERYVATGQLKIIYRHLLQLGEASIVAAEASECAGEQGRLWELREQLYARQDQLYRGELRQVLSEIASQLGLDTNQFNACLDERRYLAHVQADYAAAQEGGIRGRPVFEIGGNRLIGAQPLSVFEQALASGQ